MEIRQKRFGVMHTFTFHDSQLEFHYKDRSGEGDFEVAYSEIPGKHSVVVHANDWLRNVGLLWCGLGVLQIVVALSRGGSLVGTGFWAVLGLTCLAVYRFRRIRYSVYKTSEGNIFVLQGKGHDAVAGEMMKRRQAQLLEWYGEVNFEIEPEREIAKFQWLEKQKVLTPEEAASKIAQVRARTGDPSNENEAGPN